MFDKENQIHLTIESLEQIVINAKELRKSNPLLTDIVRITKTASRQDGAVEDKVETSLLIGCTIPENVEG